jgi:hypothetical protein
MESIEWFFNLVGLLPDSLFVTDSDSTTKTRTAI